MSVSADRSIDPSLFREVMGHYPTGVALITGVAPDGELLALVVGTFSSVSLEPPLVSFMPMKSSRTFDKLRECESLCINILGEEQEDLVSTIARRWEQKFDGIEWSPSAAGNPILSESVAWIDVTIENVVEAGDHWIVLCAVHDLAVENPASPLLFFQGGYGGFLSTTLVARADQELSTSVANVQGVSGIIEGLARGIGCEVSLFTAISRDEFAQVLSAVAPGIDRTLSLGHRLPIVPPIGDTYVFAKSITEQERWISKARGATEEDKQIFRERLEFVRDNGHLLSFLPDEGSQAYDEMTQATRRYASSRMTPAEERVVREAIFKSSVDYGIRTLDPEEVYRIGSMVFPVRSADGEFDHTLRLSQFPGVRFGHEVNHWVQRARSAIQLMESVLVKP
ncbi:flavin reductase family protein [Kocuria sp. cx-455]|uniref:flavin reductase family protein n=1 Tax=Kocuria sp. cx-455 TaxID=2771377 RepID=UPI003D71CC37